MLQIVSGKFFNESINTKEVIDKDIFYSNIKIFGKVETELWTLESINITHGVSSYLLTLNGKYFEDTSRVYYPEASNQFRLLTAFWFKAIFEHDKSNVEMLCRKMPQNPNDNQIPSTILPEYFSLEKVSGFDNYKNFITKVVNLSREEYNAIISSIDLFFQSLNAMNYNLELAFSLMIFSIESLAQKFDGFEENWDDYNNQVKLELDKLVKVYCVSDEDYDNLKQILLKNDHQKATKRFISFCMDYVGDDFFTVEAIDSKTPLKKSDLKHVLRNCYSIRSQYVHSLKKIEKHSYLVSIMDSKETLGNEDDIFLTFTGLTRLVHHILKNFIFSCEECGFEYINFTEEIPDRVNMTFAPQNWITKEEGFKAEDIFIYYHYFLNLIPYLEKEDYLEFKNLMYKIEELLKKGIKKRYKSANLIFYYLCNRLYGDEGITENFIQNCEKYDMSKVLSKLSIETLICKLVLKDNIDWELWEVIDCYQNYLKNKFRKNALNLGDLYEILILIVICKSFYANESYSEFNEWMEKLILELPAKVDCQKYVQDCIDENKDINFEEFKELFFNG